MRTCILMPGLRNIRERKGVTLRSLAEKADVAVSTLARYEAGQGDPQLSILSRIASTLGVSVADLIKDMSIRKGGQSHGTHQTKG